MKSSQYSSQHAVTLVTVVLVGIPMQAHADSVAPNAAQILFDDARRLMVAARFADACPKLAESEKLAPASGTLLNLAVCHEREGKTASAWLEYHDVIALSLRERNTARRSIASQRIEALEGHLTMLKVNAPVRVPRGLWLTIDGEHVGREALRSTLPVDPGTHHVEYGAPGYEARELSIELRREGQSVVDLPELRRRAFTGSAKREQTVRRGWTAVGAGFGVGTAAFGAVAYFGIGAGEAWAERNRHCPAGICDGVAVEEGRHAQQLATAADVALGIGVVATAVGAYFLVSTLQARIDVGANGRFVLAAEGTL
jgi:hypothetical protein